MLLPWLLALGTLSLANDVTVQQIAVAPATQQVAPGDVATVTIVYDSSDSTVAGLGVRVHYDSSKLLLESADLLYAPGLLGRQDQEDAGTQYLDQHDDGDRSTDRRYVASWTSLQTDWPGESTVLPLDLLRLRFRSLQASVQTEIRLTGDRCATCTLQTAGGEIRTSGGGQQSAAPPTATPIAATGVATATPTPTITPTPGVDPPGGPDAPAVIVPSVQGIPTLSGLGVLLVAATLAGSAIAVLFRQRR